MGNVRQSGLGLFAGILGLTLSACVTISEPIETSDNKPAVFETDNSEKQVSISKPVSPVTKAEPPSSAPPPPVTAPPPIVEIIPTPVTPSLKNPKASAVAALEGWNVSDVTPALRAFRRSCKRWKNAKADDYINESLYEYGTYGDWLEACEVAKITATDFYSAQLFFENYFEPVHLSPQNGETGLLTGYYQPEIEVRRRADPYFNEPILAVPAKKATRKLPRSKIDATTSRVIAYGRPMDVFFMQIQGSGHIRFKDGATVRAAYASNNGHAYSSIGRVLIKRGEITKDKSSKRDIERWMAKAGPKKSRDLMNENKRYIFFVEQKIEVGAGPNGAMGVPLTGMGSMAVDPRYHPYGALIWLKVKLPTKSGDYRGKEQGILLAAQDTGKAIRGAMRGDIYFGSGKTAGGLAGVMKHSGDWSLLLPKPLAARLKANSGAS